MIKHLILLALAGVFLAIGAEPRDNIFITAVCVWIMTGLMDVAFSRLAVRRERDRIETWLRHKGHTRVADRLHEEF